MRVSARRALTAVWLAGCAVIVACSGADDTGGGAATDAGVQPGNDATVGPGGDAASGDGATGADGSGDSGESDGGNGGDASALPSLCTTYPNVNISIDGGAPVQRYRFIGFDTFGQADFDCAVGDLFTGNLKPQQYACLTLELMSIAGCVAGGLPVPYNETSRDLNNAICVPVGAGDNVHLGFHNAADNLVTEKDVLRVADFVRASAVKAGMAPADADRLKAGYLAKKSTAVFSADPGYSHGKCDGGP